MIYKFWRDIYICEGVAMNVMNKVFSVITVHCLKKYLHSHSKIFTHTHTQINNVHCLFLCCKKLM